MIKRAVLGKHYVSAVILLTLNAAVLQVQVCGGPGARISCLTLMTEDVYPGKNALFRT